MIGEETNANQDRERNHNPMDPLEAARRVEDEYIQSRKSTIVL